MLQKGFAVLQVLAEVQTLRRTFHQLREPAAPFYEGLGSDVLAIDDEQVEGDQLGPFSPGP
jgi:hypothetical protein